MKPWHGDKGVERFEFSPQGEFLVTAGGGRTHIWNTSDWKVLASLAATVPTPQQFHISDDGRKLLTISGAVAALHDTKTGSLLWEFEEPGGLPIRAAALFDQGRRLAVLSDKLVIWNPVRQHD